MKESGVKQTNKINEMDSPIVQAKSYDLSYLQQKSN